MSLQEQRDGISRYSERNQLPITIWLEEMETAAKQGRGESVQVRGRHGPQSAPAGGRRT